eukprot:COSAG01_NODE_43279_length_431_cov_1.048193_1_plen_100_part_01
MFMMTCQTHLLKKLRNNLFRSGRTKKHHKRCLHHFDRKSNTWQIMEWETLKLLYKEDRDRFPASTRHSALPTAVAAAPVPARGGASSVHRQPCWRAAAAA